MDKAFFVDLSEFQLSEEETPRQWIHAMPLGEYKHPVYGRIKFTEDRIRRFAQNIVNNVRGVDLAIDFSHQSGAEAAGWVKTAEARPNGLWLLVEWTTTAAEKIRNKEFRYFSPEFKDTWQDAEGKSFKDVLFGGGLTSRPFLKDLVPVVLSELEQVGEAKKEEEYMPEFLEKLRKALSLSEDATEEEILEAAAKSEEIDVPGDNDDEEQELSESEELVQLAESNPAVKRLIGEVAALQIDARNDRINKHLSEWTTGASDSALSPVAAKKIKTLLESADKQLSEEIVDFVNSVLDDGVITLSETPIRRKQKNSKPAIVRFEERIKELQEASPGMTFGEASAEASRDEELFAEYLTEQLSTSEEVN